MYSKEEKKKLIAVSVFSLGKDENINEDNSEGMTLINHGFLYILRERQQRPQQALKNNDLSRNNDRCYHSIKLSHIKQYYLKLRKGLQRKTKTLEHEVINMS